MEENYEESQVLVDPVGDLIEEDVPRSKFELSPDGYYERWIPSDEEHAQLANYVYSYIRNLEAENAEILNEIADNVDAYRAKSKTMGSNTDEDPVVMLPLISRKIDQLVAFQTATVVQPRPLVSVEPYFDDEYEVMSSDMVEGPMGPVEVGLPKSFTSEEVAATAEFALDYKLRERMNIERVIKKTFHDIAVANYAVLKVVWDEKTQTIRRNRTKKLPTGHKFVDGTEDRLLKGRETARILNVNLFGFLAPVDCPLDEAELVCELCPTSVANFRESLSSGEYFLPKKDEWDALVKMTTDDYRLEQDRTISLKPTSPTIERHDTREVWFDWSPEVEDVDEEGNTYRVMKRMSMCGIFHMGAKKFMTLYRNPYNHNELPYELVTEDEDSRRRPELSMVGRTKKQQTLVSQMLHLNLQNAIAASNFDIFCIPDTDAWHSLKEQGRKPGRLIPRSEKDEVEMAQPGKNHPGLNQEIGFISQDIADTMGVTPYEEGSMIPGRTPADTVRQILQSGLQRPLMTMGTVSKCLGKAIKKYLLLLKQFRPYGEIVPTRNPETHEKLSIPFLLPAEDVLANFEIALTAAEESLAKEADQEQRIMMFNLLRDSLTTFAQMSGAMADINASPALTEQFLEFSLILRRAMQLIIEPVRRDVTKFLPSEEKMMAIVQEKQQNVMMAMQQQQMMGGMNGGPTGGGGPVPGGGPAPGPGGPMGAEPGNPGVGAASAA